MLEIPVVDIITTILDFAVSDSIKGASRYSDMECNGCFFPGSGFKGSHGTDCGERSTNTDYLLRSGHITNSLAPYYLKWYRNSIPQSEFKKIAEVLYAYADESIFEGNRKEIFYIIKELREEK